MCGVRFWAFFWVPHHLIPHIHTLNSAYAVLIELFDYKNKQIEL